ncbi:DUF5682 family protein [Streptomyces sp. NPDC006208]|uniref:DUF5682 family protein n=1 Tax=Streptomyces sp. NPDC006208 TaxID=3156734 RepID=UPI00339DC879
MAELAGCRDPYLIGVRHHSPALAAAVPALLAEAAPEVLFIELPEEFAPWLEHLADPATVPPVALAGSGGGGGRGLVFLPFAEFSPELAAIRWAREAGVQVVPFDLPLAARWDAGSDAGTDPDARPAEDPPAGPGPEAGPDAGPGRGAATGAQPRSGTGARSGAQTGPRTARPTRAGALAAALRARAGGRPGDDLWDRLVEATAPGSEPEALRRAALAVGWALRSDTGAVDAHDLRREANMRRHLRAWTGRRAAAVIGAFHAPALLPGSVTAPAETELSAEGPAVVTSLVPYAYALLDERSGYPAGIRDPEWQRGVFHAAGDHGRLDELLTGTAVRICAAVRDAGHPSGPADAREVVRMARDLATLRGLPAAGRGELAEAAQTVLTQGQLLGRGRVVAAAMERVLVGTRLGRLAPGTPRSGLGPAVEALLGELRLPWPGEPGRRELRLDILRSDLDRRREICLRRLTLCHVPYGEESHVAGVGDAAALTTQWAAAWSPSTTAMLDMAGVHGVTLEQAAAGMLRRRRHEQQRQGGPTAADVIQGLTEAARCALPEIALSLLAEAAVLLPATGTLPELLAGMTLLDRIRSGHLAGLGEAWERAAVDAAYEELSAAGVRALDGLAGSTEPDDARALVALAGRADALGGGLRLADALARLDTSATPLIRGAAGAARVLLGQRDAGEFGTRLASRTDSATSPELRTALTGFLRGTLLAAGPLMEAGRALDPLLERVESLPDRDFLNRLPALRAGFEALAPAARARLLSVVEDRTGTAAGTLTGPVTDPTILALLAAADLTGREALTARQLPPVAAATGPETAPPGDPETALLANPGAAAVSTRARAHRHSAESGHGLVGPLGPGAAPAANTPGADPAPPGPTTDRTTASDAATAKDAPAGAATTGPETAPTGVPGDPGTPESGAPAAPTAPDGLGAGERWRLLLGQGRELTGSAGRVAAALDELYGRGRGEGSRGEDGYGGSGQGGGTEAPYPDVRAWAEELTALFGPGVREEVLAAAADAGRLDAALEVDPASARPSVELLRTVLSYAGGMPEQQLARLRPLVARLVRELTAALANRLRPALTGLARPRPTRRPGGPLDLPRTLRANLATASRDPATGAVTVLPERPVFRTRSRRAADWRLVLVVDVSGSMEASTIWSALTASVLAGVPVLSTHFVAFSTEVLDLTDHVDDPLSLLLEVRVGGGTSIARGLRHARELVTVPSRTLVVLVSDFEEGGPVGPLLSEVRALVDAGCHVLGCASLDDRGRPRYSAGVAGRLVAAGMPVAALSPLELARWVGERVGGTHR